MNIRIFIVVLLIGVQVILCAEKEDDNDEDTFVPTEEWKPIKKGQKVPEGLHIRINLETGVTEAKLLKKNEKSNENALSVTSSGNKGEATDDKFKISASELKQALKNIKNEVNEEEIKGKYRSYDELKRDFDELNVRPKTDAEILRELLDRHDELIERKEIDEEEILTVIEDLEYLVHQYDNAKEFVTLNGLEDIVYKNLNSSSVEIRKGSLKLLGGCVQNNALVKTHALDSGCIDVLLRVIALESDPSIKYLALFSLGALLRDFPFAQFKFIQNAGLSVFMKLFESENLKIQLRTVTIVNDLLEEEVNSHHDKNKEKAKQYKNVNFRQHLINHHYCDVLNRLLINSVIIDSNDHDIIEQCLGALYTVIGDCYASLTSKSRDILVSLRNLYKKLNEKEEAIEDDEQDHYRDLYELSNNIVKTFQRNKDEF